MAQSPEGCWVLLLDGGTGPYQLDPLPRMLMQVGPRVALSLTGPTRYPGGGDCRFPILALGDFELADWSLEPSASVTAFMPEVRAALESQRIDAAAVAAGTVITVPGLTAAEALALQGVLRGRYGMFMRVGADELTTIWPAQADPGD